MKFDHIASSFWMQITLVINIYKMSYEMYMVIFFLKSIDWTIGVVLQVIANSPWNGMKQSKESKNIAKFDMLTTPFTHRRFLALSFN